MKRVLVVDDDPNARLLVRTLLTHAGYASVEASSGAEALARVAEERPDLVILDLALPDMHGADLVRALRGPGPRIRIALYTASPIDAAMRDFMAIYEIAGALPKPAEPQEFLAALAAIIEKE